MRAKVKTDETYRNIQIELEDGPELEDSSVTWRTRPRPFKAERVDIHIDRGETRSITVSGPLVLKGGRLSDSQRDKASWRLHSYTDSQKIDNAPGWVRELFHDAPLGVTGWAWKVVPGA